MISRNSIGVLPIAVQSRPCLADVHGVIHQVAVDFHDDFVAAAGDLDFVPFAGRLFAVVREVQMPAAFDAALWLFNFDRRADDPEVAGVAMTQLHFQ